MDCKGDSLDLAATFLSTSARSLLFDLVNWSHPADTAQQAGVEFQMTCHIHHPHSPDHHSDSLVRNHTVLWN